MATMTPSPRKMRNAQFLVLLGAAKTLRNALTGAQYTAEQLELVDAVIRDSEVIAEELRRDG